MPPPASPRPAAARFAQACQEEGLVPVIQPDVVGGGREAASAAFLVTFAELWDYGVRLDDVVLAPAMVLPEGPPEAVAAQTLAALQCAVPGQVAGVAFLSRGQGPEEATGNLAAIGRFGAPWPLTFCSGGALAGPAVAAWRGRWVAAGQRALANRVACNVAALRGSYPRALRSSYVLA
jgi:fructose-bisphosphate aldolase, class I